MNKKGMAIVSEWIVDLFFLLMVVVVLLGGITRLQDNKLHNLRVEARDYAFTHDASIITPYQLDYNYKIKNDISLSINLDKCLIQTKYTNENTPPVVFSCLKDQNLDLKEEVDQNNIRMKKDE